MVVRLASFQNQENGHPYSYSSGQMVSAFTYHAGTPPVRLASAVVAATMSNAINVNRCRRYHEPRMRGYRMTTSAMMAEKTTSKVKLSRRQLQDKGAGARTPGPFSGAHAPFGNDGGLAGSWGFAA
jgi:hypothetical protein